MKLSEVDDLPPTLDGHQAAELLGCSYWHLLELVKRGEAPVEPLRLGRSLRWPTAAVLRALGIDWAPAPRDETERDERAPQGASIGSDTLIATAPHGGRRDAG